jgi:hypothetical protein
VDDGQKEDGRVGQTSVERLGEDKEMWSWWWRADLAGAEHEKLQRTVGRRDQ